MLYTTIIRDSDGYFCMDECEESDEHIRDRIKSLKDLIDAELLEDDPWEERVDDTLVGEWPNQHRHPEMPA